MKAVNHACNIAEHELQLALQLNCLRLYAGLSADRPRATPQPKLPFEKFWKCLELTWLYEPYFLSVRRYVFDSDSHRSESPALLACLHATNMCTADASMLMFDAHAQT